MIASTLDIPSAGLDEVLPVQFGHLDVFVEPLTLIETHIAWAFEADAFLCGWRPSTAAVIGAGTRGLLTTLALRLRGLDVTLLHPTRPVLREATLAAQLGATCRVDAGDRDTDIVIRAGWTRKLDTRGILGRAPQARIAPDRQFVDAAIRNIIAADTRYPGWLTRLSSVRYE